MNMKPRPYVAKFRCADGKSQTHHVLAYDINEAMLTASARAVASGAVSPQLYDIEPDMAALAEAKEADNREWLLSQTTAWAAEVFKDRDKSKG